LYPWWFLDTMREFIRRAAGNEAFSRQVLFGSIFPS
jgi:hypothetical protein